MLFEEFVVGIRFRLIKPSTPFPRNLQIIEKLLFKAFDISLESYITQFQENDSQIKSDFNKLITIPKMSTLALGAIINYGVRQLPPNQVFVNVGVWNGFSFLSGLLNNPEKKCIGIDNFSQFGGPEKDFLLRFNKLKSNNHFFYNMDYEKYFQNNHNDKIGFYIYDGEHNYENQLKGLTIAEPYFAEKSIIFIDDTNWAEPRKATLDFIKDSNNKYEIIFDVTTHSNKHPTYWNGIMILQKQ